jgi:hypothetical protein
MERVKSELRRDILYHLKYAELAKEYGLALKGRYNAVRPSRMWKDLHN